LWYCGCKITDSVNEHFEGYEPKEDIEVAIVRREKIEWTNF